ncbi:MAG: muconolactone Delta-isomerase family protein [Gammaproteobacteria bacterium]
MMTADLAKPESMPSKEFFEIWYQESLAALEALEAGAMKAIWKVAGQYQVIAVVDVAEGDDIDEIVHNLPIWRLGHAHLVPTISWKPLRDYGNWSKQLKGLSGA